MSYITKSPWVIHYDGSSCNGCDIEVLACLMPMYDVERFGIINTGNPKHADVFLVTGSVNEQNKDVVKQIYDQMPEPKVVVAVGINQDKRGFFDMDKKLDIIHQATAGMKGVSVIQYDNLTIDTCRELGIRHIVRGVRNMIDFETERSIADANRRLAPEIETIIIPTAQEFAHISSSAVRDILKHHGDYSAFIPKGVKL